MGRFNYEDEDFQDEDLFPDTGDDDFIRQQETLDLMQLDIVRTDLNQRLLSRIIRMCENSANWHKKGHKARLKMIVECYTVFSSLVEGQNGAS